jgi:hypothetical protein
MTSSENVKVSEYFYALFFFAGRFSDLCVLYKWLSSRATRIYRMTSGP